MADDVKPNPDPSVITTESIDREIAHVKDLMVAELRSLRDTFDARFEIVMEKFDERFEGTKREREAHFEGVEKQFQLVERQRVEQKGDTALAVGAALSAAKEAVKEQTLASGLSITKSETATAEQLKQLNVTFSTAINGVTGALGDVKTRIERLENRQQGQGESKAMTFSMVAAGVSVVGVVAVIINLLS